MAGMQLDHQLKFLPAFTPRKDHSVESADDYSLDTYLGGTGPPSSATPKEPLESIRLSFGIPRSIPKTESYGRKQFGALPHARGYHNGFLCEANYAVAVDCTLFFTPILIYDAAKATKKPTDLRATTTSILFKNCYGIAASFWVLARLSMAGFEHRWFDLSDKKTGWTQQDEHAREERNPAYGLQLEVCRRN